MWLVCFYIERHGTHFHSILSRVTEHVQAKREIHSMCVTPQSACRVCVLHAGCVCVACRVCVLHAGCVCTDGGAWPVRRDSCGDGVRSARPIRRNTWRLNRCPCAWGRPGTTTVTPNTTPTPCPRGASEPYTRILLTIHTHTHILCIAPATHTHTDISSKEGVCITAPLISGTVPGTY